MRKGWSLMMMTMTKMPGASDDVSSYAIPSQCLLHLMSELSAAVLLSPGPSSNQKTHIALSKPAVCSTCIKISISEACV